MINPILPMLATSAQPFDSFDYSFEVKWDGVRALAAVQGGQWRLWGRERADYGDRYPELEVLRRLPSGTVVDGELVVFQDGRPDLNSEGIAGLGQDLFDRVVAQGHEGIMAKHQTSRYLPGKRSSAWRKIKPVQVVPCVIIGYTPSRDGFHGLLVATAHQGPLRYVAQVTSGFPNGLKMELGRRLAQRRRPHPVVACPHKALWVEPDLYCQVQFLQWTPQGHLRSASFGGLLENKV